MSRPSAPVVSSSVLAPGAFRSRVVEDGDEVFFGAVTVWSALGVVMAVALSAVEPAPLGLDQTPEVWTRVAVVAPEVRRVVVPAPPAPTESPVRSGRPATAPPVPTDPSRAPGPGRSRLLDPLRTHGDSLRDRLFGPGRDDAASALDVEVGGPGAASGSRRGRAPEGGPAEIGEIVAPDGAPAWAPVTRVTVVAVAFEPGTVSDPAGSVSLGRSVARQSGTLALCFERVLKVKPDLGGRMEVAWTVEGGRVAGSPQVVLNDTGSADMAACVAKKIERWTFDAAVRTEVTWPFVFEKR